MLRLGMLLVLASGYHVVFQIEGYDDDAGIGVPPRVYSSPGPAPDIWGGYAKWFAITLAADQPGTTIYYTTDGSMPDTTSQSATTPVRGITISTTSMVRFFGVAS